MAFYESYDPRFGSYVMFNAPLKRLATGFDWAEGPVWIGDAGCLLFSDIPNDRMLRWTPEGGISTYRAPSQYSNGNTRDRQGRLVTCEHGTRRVTRTEWDGAVTVIADSYLGKRLNSPNDVVVKSDGSIWFTDPHYGIARTALLHGRDRARAVDRREAKGEQGRGEQHECPRLDAHRPSLAHLPDCRRHHVGFFAPASRRKSAPRSS